MAPAKFLLSKSAPGGLVTPTYEALVSTSGPVSSDFGDWPAKMADAVYAAASAIEPACPLGYVRKIVATKPGSDPDGHYVRIIVMDLPETRQ